MLIKTNPNPAYGKGGRLIADGASMVVPGDCIDPDCGCRLFDFVEVWKYVSD